MIPQSLDALEQAIKVLQTKVEEIRRWALNGYLAGDENDIGHLDGGELQDKASELGLLRAVGADGEWFVVADWLQSTPATPSHTEVLDCGYGVAVDVAATINRVFQATI